MCNLSKTQASAHARSYMQIAKWLIPVVERLREYSQFVALHMWFTASELLVRHTQRTPVTTGKYSNREIIRRRRHDQVRDLQIAQRHSRHHTATGVHRALTREELQETPPVEQPVIPTVEPRVPKPLPIDFEILLAAEEDYCDLPVTLPAPYAATPHMDRLSERLRKPDSYYDAVLEAVRVIGKL